ncbi:hypothetical protein BKA70DRAFT_1121509, partial [Coprinopsis sp. MPI-PUGE-AT-0042]
DPLFLLRQQFARTVHPFVILKTVIKIEMMAVRRLEKRSETWRQGMHHCEERRDHRTFLALQQLLLLQGEDLAGSSIAVQNHIVDLVSRGQAKAWSEDLVKANDLLSQQLGDDLCGRGFDDDTIGCMLCPINLDWYKEEVQQTLRGAPQTITPQSWPRIFYQSMESQYGWEGFLRNSMLVMVLTLISFEGKSR